MLAPATLHGLRGILAMPLTIRKDGPALVPRSSESTGGRSHATPPAAAGGLYPTSRGAPRNASDRPRRHVASPRPLRELVRVARRDGDPAPLRPADRAGHRQLPGLLGSAAGVGGGAQ